MIEVRNLTKAFDGAAVLDGLDLSVQKGSIYGLIGKNGAGKTTIIQLLAGVLYRDLGEVSIFGEPVWENEDVKMRVGLVPDEPYFPLSADLSFMGQYYSKIYINWDEEYFQELALQFGLDKKKSLRSFSKGMKKQADLILTLACRPDLLLLDEPMDGLDPIARKAVWNRIVDEVAEREMTVLISSHNLRELEGICDTIGILSDGKLMLEKDLDEVKHSMYKVQVAFDGDDGSVGAAGAGRAFDGGACGGENCDARCGVDFGSLDVLHRERHGSVECLIIRESAEKIRTVIGAKNPKIFDLLPLTLEEIFIYELGGDHDELKEIL